MEVDLAFEQSDLASVAVGIYLKEEIAMGPELTRINLSVLDDIVALLGVKNDLRDLLLPIKTSSMNCYKLVTSLNDVIQEAKKGHFMSPPYPRYTATQCKRRSLQG